MESSNGPAGSGGLVRAAGGTVRPAFPYPKETSMDKRIGEAGIRLVTTSSNGSDTCHMVSVFIHHELTAERMKELEAFLETLIVRAITGWASL